MKVAYRQLTDLSSQQRKAAKADEGETSIARALFQFQEGEKSRQKAAAEARKEELSIAKEELELKRETLAIMATKSNQDNLCALLERKLAPGVNRQLLIRIHNFSPEDALAMVPLEPGERGYVE